MSGAFSVGGLISGLDTNSIIQQLMQIERQPLVRMQTRLDELNQQKEAVRGLRTQLQTLRNRVQDFRLLNVFSQFTTTSSKEEVLTVEVSGPGPVIGSYDVNVTQLASATVATSSSVLGAKIDENAALNSSGLTTEVEAGVFAINGVQFTIDPSTQSLSTILGQITSSAAGVNATYDAVTDTISFENKTAGDTSLINFGATDDTSNFLAAINIKQATQGTGVNGSTVATSTRNLGAVDPSKELSQINFASGAVTAGTFSINGITITVDTTDSLSDVVAKINGSDAQVNATYDSATDKIQIVAKTLGSRTVSFAAGTSNFLTATNLASATQTAGKDSQFSINGGPTLTRNTNEVSDAIGGVTLRLKSTGDSTVTVAGDDDAVVEDINEFLTAFNETVDQIRSLTGASGALRGDSGIQTVEMFIRDAVFSQVSGISGEYASLIVIGINTGDTFDSEAVSHLQLDEDEFREALRDDRKNVIDLFSNTGKTGVADKLFDYLDEITRVTGFLNDRSKSNGTIDQQIRLTNDRIDQLENRVAQKEERLRKQFTQLEQLSSQYQSQSSALSRISSSMGYF